MQRNKSSLGLHDKEGLPDRPEPSVSVRQRKNAPIEISSKNPALAHLSGRSGIRKHRYRDPRFDDNCGSLGEKTFEKNYQFVFELRKKELETVRRQHRNERDPEKKAQLKDLLTRLVCQ